MAIFLSDLMTNGALPVQGPTGGGEDSLTATLVVPAGTTLGTSDILKFLRLAPSVNLTEIEVRSDDLDPAASISISIGYDRPTVDPSKAFNATTNPYITGAVAAASTAYYQATSITPYQAGGVNRYVLGQAALDNEFATNPINGVANYIDIVLVPTIASSGALAAAATIYVKFTFTGKVQTPGTFSGSNAFRYKSAY